MLRTKFSNRNKGNALFYVLLGVVLLAALSYNLMRQNTSGGAEQQLSDEQAEIYAAQIINHANTVKLAIDQMLANGSTIDDIDFVLPNEAGYDTAPHQHKVFHPGGGGIEPMIMKDELYRSNSSNRGWKYQINQNTDWTPTTQSDILYSLIEPSDAICKKINKILLGSETIPVKAVNVDNTFINGGTDDGFTAAECPFCDGVASQCFFSTSVNVFYNIVAAR